MEIKGSLGFLSPGYISRMRKKVADPEKSNDIVHHHYRNLLEYKNEPDNSAADPI